MSMRQPGTPVPSSPQRKARSPQFANRVASTGRPRRTTEIAGAASSGAANVYGHGRRRSRENLRPNFARHAGIDRLRREQRGVPQHKYRVPDATDDTVGNLKDAPLDFRSPLRVKNVDADDEPPAQDVRKVEKAHEAVRAPGLKPELCQPRARELLEDANGNGLQRAQLFSLRRLDAVELEIVAQRMPLHDELSERNLGFARMTRHCSAYGDLVNAVDGPRPKLAWSFDFACRHGVLGFPTEDRLKLTANREAFHGLDHRTCMGLQSGGWSGAATEG